MIKNLWIFDKNKLLILNALYYCQDNICGCDLVNKLTIPKNLVSYHLKILKKKGFVSEARCGRLKHYQIKPEKLEIIKNVLVSVELIKG